jgi:hypothetical protein
LDFQIVGLFASGKKESRTRPWKEGTWKQFVGIRKEGGKKSRIEETERKNFACEGHKWFFLTANRRLILRAAMYGCWDDPARHFRCRDSVAEQSVVSLL